MLLQSNNNVYAYSHKSKYLIPFHPVVARFVIEAKKKNAIDLEEIKSDLLKEYSTEEITLFYRQYLYFKEQSFFEVDVKKLYGKINPEWIKESFHSTKQLVFEVTEKCNLQCAYCTYGDYYINRGERAVNDMDFALAEQLLLHYAPFWKAEVARDMKKQISIGFYGGEPLLNFELIAQIVDFCETLGFKKDLFRFSMTTNGLLIKKYQDFLIDKNFYLSVSLDGNRENNGYRVLKTGENPFDIIVDNVSDIREKNKTYFEKNIEFLAVLHDKNSMEQTLTFFKERFGKIPSLSPLSTENVIPQRKKAFDAMYKDIVSDVSHDFLLNLTESELGKYDFLSYLRKNCQHTFNHFMSVYHAKRNATTFPTGTCIPFSRKVFLTTDGKILACERISTEHVLGNVSKNSGIILDFNAIADYFNTTIFQFKNQCIDCYNKNACGLCAFKYSDDTCEGFMTEKNFIEIMAFYLSLVEKYPYLYNYSKKLITG